MIGRASPRGLQLGLGPRRGREAAQRHWGAVMQLKNVKGPGARGKDGSVMVSHAQPVNKMVIDDHA